MNSKTLEKCFFQKISILVLLLILPSLYACTCFAEQKVIIKVFHAGSLSVPFKKIEQAFENKYAWIDVRREASGSVMAVRKVIDIHKPCDVIAVADYSLIPRMMFPKYADHVRLFARNELVLCYTEKSKYSESINEKNWYEILKKEDVRWGFSNPNLDPCGYRAVMCMLLSGLYYKRAIPKMLFKDYLPFDIKEDGLVAEIPKSFSPSGRKIFIRPKEVDLLGLLESGAIDYAVEYLSVARQHHLRFLSLPPQVNLGSLKFKKYYSRVAVVFENGRCTTGRPIAYGIAALKNSSHPKEAKLFEEFVTGEKGAEILKQCYQTPIYPAEVIKANE